MIPGVPNQNANQQDALGRRTAEAVGKEVMEFHRRGLVAARQNLLLAEKYALHLDGGAGAQWADIFEGSRVVIPDAIAGQVRSSENLLRPVVDNAVAYHTTRPFRFAVEATADRESRQRAAIDQAIINHMARKGRWNRVFADAMYFAQVAGHCPIHAFWRDDMTSDPYEPVYAPPDSEEMPGQIRKGFLDAYVGDPWDTVYGPGSRRNSLHQYTYGRTLPVSLVRAAFAHVPGVERLEGATREPSASRMQRIMRRWTMEGVGVHGNFALTSGQASGEPLIALICRERAPGTDPEYPQGRITIVALPQAAFADKEGEGRHAVLLHDGPLPAGRFSHVRVYSHQRHDDIRGKPFVSDLDELQLRLNQLIMYRDEYIRRNVRAPLHSGMIVDDTATWEGHVILETEPGSVTNPQFLQLRVDVGALNTAIQETRHAIWTIGGYQAASRGESYSGDSGAKVIALARADDTIHGPINQRFREDVEDFAKLAHALFRTFGDIPWLIEATGSEYTHMVEAWVDRSMVSQDDPAVELVSGFGATLETMGNQLTQMVTTKGADGEPLMTTRQFRAAWPDRSIYPDTEDVRETRERKARAINARIRRLAREVEQVMGEMAMQPFSIVQSFIAVMQEYPPATDDDPLVHFDALSSITQDIQESELAREIAKYRQAFYQGWAIGLGMMPPPPMPLPRIEDLIQQAQRAPAQVPGQAPMPQGPQGPPQQAVGRGPIQPDMVGGTQSAEAIRPKPGEIASLTADAQGGLI